jgi:glycosyltransferase involved in cell wall biosynthesis
MKVLHVISGLRGGGAEHFVLELCMASGTDEHVDMSVLTLSAKDEISYKFTEAGIGLHAVSSGNKRGTKAFKGFLSLLKYRRTVFHAHMFHACMVACFAKLFKPSNTVVFTLHNDHVPQLHRRLMLFFSRPFRKADIIFPGMKRKWYQTKNAATIPNGINLDRFHVISDKPPVFTAAFVGRLEEEKNPLFLVDLARSLIPQHNFMIRVAGDGPLKAELEERIKEENLQSHFIIHGHVDDVPKLLSESHCVLMPSLWEGMPLVMLETAAAGIPVIATPSGNVPVLISDTEGYVGPLAKFAEMLQEVMDNYGEALIKARRLTKKINSEFGI